VDIDTYLRFLGLEPIDSEYFFRLLEEGTNDTVIREWQRLMGTLRLSRDPRDEQRLGDFALSTIVPGLGISFSELATRVWSLEKHRQVLPPILEWCRSGRRILEVGCGPGHLVGFLAKNMPDRVVVAIDFLHSAIDYTSKTLSTLGIVDVTLLRAELSELPPLYPAAFDRVLLRDVCGNEFDTDCDWDQYMQRVTDFLRSAAQVVTHDGYIWYSLSIGSVPNILEDLGWCVGQAIERSGLVLGEERSYPCRVFDEDHYHHCWLLSHGK
jgi:SAM-dependent methyltransferase